MQSLGNVITVVDWNGSPNLRNLADTNNEMRAGDKVQDNEIRVILNIKTFNIYGRKEERKKAIRDKAADQNALTAVVGRISDTSREVDGPQDSFVQLVARILFKNQTQNNCVDAFKTNSESVFCAPGNLVLTIDPNFFFRDPSDCEGAYNEEAAKKVIEVSKRAFDSVLQWEIGNSFNFWGAYRPIPPSMREVIIVPNSLHGELFEKAGFARQNSSKIVTGQCENAQVWTRKWNVNPLKQITLEDPNKPAEPPKQADAPTQAPAPAPAVTVSLPASKPVNTTLVVTPLPTAPSPSPVEATLTPVITPKPETNPANTPYQWQQPVKTSTPANQWKWPVRTPPTNANPSQAQSPAPVPKGLCARIWSAISRCFAGLKKFFCR